MYKILVEIWFQILAISSIKGAKRENLNEKSLNERLAQQRALLLQNWDIIIEKQSLPTFYRRSLSYIDSTPIFCFTRKCWCYLQNLDPFPLRFTMPMSNVATVVHYRTGQRKILWFHFCLSHYIIIYPLYWWSQKSC